MAYSRVKSYLVAACLIIMVVAVFAAESHDDHMGHDDHSGHDHAMSPKHDDHGEKGASTSLAPFPSLIVSLIAFVFLLARN
ncbi:hypothetical protein BVRB_6g147860 [Beta vulgaris subsp. vulgaris]|nr:hypothetical protein BVRB_6g147860 [Beta vulgaris subsp. vulgaris]